MDLIKTLFAGRPWWMNAVMLFCAYMTFIYMPFDLFLKPVAEDQEVWFGYMLTGWAAKATEPLHWAIYGAGTYGFYRMKSWMWPWAALYVGQIVFGMIVWGVLYGGGTGGALALAGATAALALLVALTIALWRAKPRFGATDVAPETQPPSH
jgi:hypothetical protein